MSFTQFLTETFNLNLEEIDITKIKISLDNLNTDEIKKLNLTLIENSKYNNFRDVKETFKTNEFWLEACKQNGHSIQFVKEQTPEICLAAVKQNGSVLNYVKEQTIEMCELAIQKRIDSYIYIDYNRFIPKQTQNEKEKAEKEKAEKEKEKAEKIAKLTEEYNAEMARLKKEYEDAK